MKTKTISALAPADTQRHALTPTDTQRHALTETYTHRNALAPTNTLLRPLTHGGHTSKRSLPHHNNNSNNERKIRQIYKIEAK